MLCKYIGKMCYAKKTRLLSYLNIHTNMAVKDLLNKEKWKCLNSSESRIYVSSITRKYTTENSEKETIHKYHKIDKLKSMQVNS